MVSPEEYLRELTKAVCKSINRLNDALQEKDDKRRHKLARRTLQELEIVNDEVMRSALGLTVYQIANAKTRKHGKSGIKHAAVEGPKELSPHQQLMQYHSKHLMCTIPDGGAQGAAVSWLLKHFTPELAIRKYDEQLSDPFWSKAGVSWLTVKQQLGRTQGNAVRAPDASERNSDRLDENIQFIRDIRSGTR